MSEKQDNGSESEKDASNLKKDSIAIIYHQKNDSPKYFEIKRSKIFLFFIGLPALTLVALTIGAIGLLNSNPFQLAANYRQNKIARSEMSNHEDLQEKVLSLQQENLRLETACTQNPVAVAPTTTAAKTPAQPTPAECPTTPVSSTSHSIGLSTLSFFKPIQNQQDKTRPATLNLSGFKTSTERDTVSLLFNIIPSATDDSKISGHIVVLMKNDIAIQVYPLQALVGNDFQINYSAGEPFATQRFRPVNASFIKPRKSGNYSFTVFIFSRSGDLLHFQTIVLPLKL